MECENDLNKSLRSKLNKIFREYPEITAVYLFGSYLEDKSQAQDIDLAVLIRQPVENQVNLYMELYSRLVLVLNPLEPDLLFLHAASLALRFEAVAFGKLIYSGDEESRTDYEYALSGEYMDFSHHQKMAIRELFETVREENRFV